MSTARTIAACDFQLSFEIEFFFLFNQLKVSHESIRCVCLVAFSFAKNYQEMEKLEEMSLSLSLSLSTTSEIRKTSFWFAGSISSLRPSDCPETRGHPYMERAACFSLCGRPLIAAEICVSTRPKSARNETEGRENGGKGNRVELPSRLWCRSRYTRINTHTHTYISSGGRFSIGDDLRARSARPAETATSKREREIEKDG